MRPQPYTKNCRQQRKAGSRRSGLLQKITHRWLPNAKCLALKTYMQVTLYGLSKSFIGIYMHILCTYACDNNENTGHDLKESGDGGRSI